MLANLIAQIKKPQRSPLCRLNRTKSTTNCDVHLAESLFQTRARVKSVIMHVHMTFLNY
ncbi:MULTISPECIES: DUF6783 domain-containing protein [unclassified Blautia]|uniref:DUF6783 domain-containing protein n=1 Tax=unclassified Blautia TaxID=2648079 RepID=UPI003F8B3A6D